MTQLPLRKVGIAERITASVLSVLLHRANAIAPNQDQDIKHSFYAIKNRILIRYAEAESVMDVQKIVRECYRCHGLGMWGAYRRDGGYPCSKCKGTGVYRTDYFGLARYNLAGRMFHRPVREWNALPPDTSITIEGRIQHAHPGASGWESMLWLALIFNRRLFMRMLDDADAPRKWTWIPLTNLHQTWQAWIGRRRHIGLWLENNFHWKWTRCHHCRRWIRNDCCCPDCTPF